MCLKKSVGEEPMPAKGPSYQWDGTVPIAYYYQWNEYKKMERRVEWWAGARARY